MSLDDPFGRSADKRERDYQNLRATLAAAGVDTAAQVGAMRRNLYRNGLVVAGLAAAVTGGVALLVPRFAAFVAICAAVVGIWVVASTIRGRAHLARYQRELDGS
ncbi:MAG: hypothetical protein KDH15_02955 [Rhodocyclaceae bacterium]|nr:hypothetical protein [Rhodocyclaceae bacterium]